MIKQWKYTVSKNGRHQISQIGCGNICMVWNCREKESNAHLIAAAPEMYQLLFDLSEMNGYELAGFIENTDDLIKLLAKARGEK
ncbi:hypothetical protein NVP1047O_57 [Vibrio phage 1.047.O._10N.286.55.F2]|nr:hypothetical protein NVP1047O_57 [Vibrio phage 1.047.O._10N.286.55.F2]